MATRRTFSSISRTKLLRAIRGELDDQFKQGVLRCFPLLREHVKPAPPTPTDFHSTLCDLIRSARQRITLASLYIGPAADCKYEKEAELLDALRHASSRKIDIKILLDQHRALRPVPLKDSTTESTSSAEACKMAVSESGKVHLLSVLPPLLERMLPNPYNEVAGVFHIKAYIIDDQLILSGANLSEEYFVDRIDRYFWVTCPELVQCYQNVVDALCEHGVEYNSSGDIAHPTTSRKEVLDKLKAILTTSACKTYEIDDDHGPDDPIAYAVPTFHAPPTYVRGFRMFKTDNQVLHSLLKTASQLAHHNQQKAIACRIATAYLNPTDAFLCALEPLKRTIFLTAGRVSHGFKPKPKAGNKGRDWIPTVFEHSAQLTTQKLGNSIVTYYQRPDWSFHAKGIWLTDCDDDDVSIGSNIRLPLNSQVYAVTHGSSNYGQRSAYRDMESNLFLVLPKGSPLEKVQAHEWNKLCDYAVTAEQEGISPILPQIRGAFPVIRYFF